MAPVKYLEGTTWWLHLTNWREPLVAPCSHLSGATVLLGWLPPAKPFLVQELCRFTLLTNELQPKHKAEHYALLPFLPGHDYVLLPGVGDGQVRIAYSDVVPTFLQKYAYMTTLSHPEVTFCITLRTKPTI